MVIVPWSRWDVMVKCLSARDERLIYDSKAY